MSALRDLARLVPDTARLVKRLAFDRSLPWGTRVWLLLLVAYLAVPIDLVPDFVPVIGYLDDAALVVLTLRAVISRAGPEIVERHWPGDEQGLAVLRRALRLPDA